MPVTMGWILQSISRVTSYRGGGKVFANSHLSLQTSFSHPGKFLGDLLNTQVNEGSPSMHRALLDPVHNNKKDMVRFSIVNRVANFYSGRH